MKDLWIFVDEVEAIKGLQRNCFSWSIIDANGMQRFVEDSNENGDER